MTRDDIIKMAQEAGFRFPANYDVREPIRRLEHFAALIEKHLSYDGIHTNNKARWYQEGVEAECEAFIALVENYAQQYHEPVWAFDLIKKIRARGER
jgi:hypothetical protein